MGMLEKDAKGYGLRFERIASGIQETMKRKRVTNPERKLLKRIVLLFYDFCLLTFLNGKNRSNP
jgi:hypothetical protein